MFITIPAGGTRLSMEILRPRGDSISPAARPAPARAASAAMTMAARPAAIPRAEAPASVAVVVDPTAAAVAAVITNQIPKVFLLLKHSQQFAKERSEPLARLIETEKRPMRQTNLNS